MLSLYLESESRRWAAQQHSYYPASTIREEDDTGSSSNMSDCEDSDIESVFSKGGFSSGRSRRSSVSSVVLDEAEEAAGFEQPRDLSGNPIAVYASLDQAVALSTQRIEAEGPPRRLVTPGKLYENEEEDDEIVEPDQGSPQPSDMSYGCSTTAGRVVSVG
ncbi:hypothetical protein GGR52DRAFT_289637 [Hypoxylon sp. FL1284]|nr:hypothetical protein GGR52DRAFT_289637 [Hypoxylon sp. FL1284]